MPARIVTAPAALTLATACLVALGCERPPAPSQAAKATAAPVASTQPADSDVSAVAEMIREEAGAAANGLPPGHPPLTGTPRAASRPTTRPAMPPGHPPLTDVAQSPPSPRGPAAEGQASRPTAARPSPATALQYDVPNDWERQQPSSMMRLAQYRLPRAPADTEDTELVVFHFGPGGGGGVEANVERWISMFTTADDRPLPKEAAQRETLEVNGLKVHLVDATGFFTSPPMVGGTGERSKSAYRLLGAIVEGPGGPWFFRAVGPLATVSAARDPFMQMLRSARQ